MATRAARPGKGKPLILAALGARGTGKSAWVKQTLEVIHPTRLAVWDLMQEHEGAATDKLGDAIRAMRSSSFRVAFHPSRDDDERARQFELWCTALLAAGRATCLVEELAFVTKPSWAPRAWREMILLGRHPKHQLSIIGTSQRPAQVDKDFLGNCDLVHSGRLAARNDARVVAEVLGVDFRELLQLPDLAYIERAAGASSASRGALIFSGKERRSSTARPRPIGPTPKPQAAIPAAPQEVKQSAPFSLADLSSKPQPEPTEWTKPPS